MSGIGDFRAPKFKPPSHWRGVRGPVFLLGLIAVPATFVLAIVLPERARWLAFAPIVAVVIYGVVLEFRWFAGR
jgi:hypothetical protein